MAVRPSTTLIVDYTPDEEERDKAYCWKRRTRIEKSLLIFLIILLTAVLSLAIVLATMRQQNRIKETEGITLCLSPACVTSASFILDAMNSSADPCENFHSFACGNWEKDNPIPDGKDTHGPMYVLKERLSQQLKKLVSAPIQNNEVEAIKKTKMMYKACLNLEKVWEATRKDLVATFRQYGGWPIIDPEANVSNFDWISVEASFVLLPSKASLVKFDVNNDLKNTSRKIISLKYPDTFQERTYVLRKKDTERYKQLMIEVVMYLANGTASLYNVTRDVDDVVQLERELVAISVIPAMKRGMRSVYDYMNINEFQNMTDEVDRSQNENEIDWLRFIQAAMNGIHQIDAEEAIVVWDADYFMQLTYLLGRKTKRILVNYMLWNYVHFSIKSISKDITETYLKYKSKTASKKSLPERWRTCLQDVREYFDMALSHMFIQDSFPASSKAEAEEMIENIKSAFMEMLTRNEWMDNVTKEAALEKAAALTTSSGYPEWILNTTKLNTYYEKVKVTEDNYASAIKSAYATAVRRSLVLLREYPLDKTIWKISPVKVNAYYDNQLNTIKIPAGILQFPFFVGGIMMALNFGSIGSIIGHEITHGFDNKGRLFDKHGHVAKWWSVKAITKFDGLTQCYMDQYANYCPHELLNYNKPKCVDGKLTLGEYIADNAGLKAAYKGYKKWILKHKEKPNLPGLDYTPDQLFFLAFAQKYCTNILPKVLHNQVRRDVHSPNKYRILGTLSNSKEFAKAYNCPPSATMNRGKEQCEIW